MIVERSSERVELLTSMFAIPDGKYLLGSVFHHAVMLLTNLIWKQDRTQDADMSGEKFHSVIFVSYRIYLCIFINGITILHSFSIKQQI